MLLRDFAQHGEILAVLPRVTSEIRGVACESLRQIPGKHGVSQAAVILSAHEGDQTAAAGDLKFVEDGMEMLLHHGHA
jgi:hypothetical protein